MAPTFPAKQTANRELPQDCLTRLGIVVATFCDMWSENNLNWYHMATYNFFNRKSLPFHAFPQPSIHIGMLVVLTTLWNKLSKMGDSANYPLKSPSTEWCWMIIVMYRKCIQAAMCILEIWWIEYRYFKNVFLDIYNCMHKTLFYKFSH